MIFRNSERRSTTSGSPDRELFVPSLVDGTIVLRSSGKINLFEQIQNEAELCDINLLVSRYNAGDLNALNSRQGFFGDFSLAPDSYRDALDKIRAGKQFFDSLSDDERSKFSSFEEFVNSDFQSFVSHSDIGPVSESDPDSQN